MKANPTTIRGTNVNQINNFSSSVMASHHRCILVYLILILLACPRLQFQCFPCQSLAYYVPPLWGVLWFGPRNRICALCIWGWLAHFWVLLVLEPGIVVISHVIQTEFGFKQSSSTAAEDFAWHVTSEVFVISIWFRDILCHGPQEIKEKLGDSYRPKYLVNWIHHCASLVDIITITDNDFHLFQIPVIQYVFSICRIKI